MSLAAKVLIALIALGHIYFLVLEMFLWTKPRTRAMFSMSAEKAEQSRVLAANQGLHNGFLAAGLFVAGYSAAFAFHQRWMPVFATDPLARLGYAVDVLRGTHTRRGDVVHRRGSRVSVSGEDFWISADGEITGPERRRTWHVEPAAYSMLSAAK